MSNVSGVHSLLRIVFRSRGHIVYRRATARCPWFSRVPSISGDQFNFAIVPRFSSGLETNAPGNVFPGMLSKSEEEDLESTTSAAPRVTSEG